MCMVLLGNSSNIDKLRISIWSNIGTNHGNDNLYKRHYKAVDIDDFVEKVAFTIYNSASQLCSYIYVLLKYLYVYTHKHNQTART